MKKSILISIMPLLALFIFIAAQSPLTVTRPVAEDPDLDWPEEVVSLLKQSCFDCHSSDASNIKAKGALNFSKWADYKITKQINKLNGISEEVKGKNMPPNKYLDKNPDAALTDVEIGVITNWANKEADKLMEE
jgi:mono/diheme cytochrome c family protein